MTLRTRIVGPVIFRDAGGREYRAFGRVTEFVSNNLSEPNTSQWIKTEYETDTGIPINLNDARDGYTLATSGTPLVLVAD